MKSFENKENEYYNLGYQSNNYNCPYISGQKVKEYWEDGFVDKCIKNKIIPKDAPTYIQGRISFALGLSLSDHPSQEDMTGRWVSGWLVQKDLQARH